MEENYQLNNTNIIRRLNDNYNSTQILNNCNNDSNNNNNPTQILNNDNSNNNPTQILNNDNNNNNNNNNANNPTQILNIDNNNPTQMSENDIIHEMVIKQLKNIPLAQKLLYDDIQRIGKFLKTSIFDNDHCSLWNGYITNENNKSKGTYINFYFNKKKISLHRIMYINFVENIEPTQYIKYICQNKGKCCNVNHLQKYTYKKQNHLNLEEKIRIENEKKIKEEKEKAEIRIGRKKIIIYV